MDAAPDAIGWADVAEHLTGLAHIATVTPVGGPHVAVVAPAVVDGTIWIGTRRSSRKAANVAATPSIALMWSSTAEVYVWARAELVDDLGVKRELWDGAWSYDPAGFFGTPDDPDYVLLEAAAIRATVLAPTERGPSRRHWHA